MSNALTCLILDDEPIAVDILKDYASKVPGLACLGTFRDPVEALSFLQSHPLDLLFLDINMPGLTGLQLISALPRPPRVVFTTAYAEYALTSYEFSAVDYLLKPIEFQRFLKAVNKVRDTLLVSEPASQSVLVKSGTKHHRFHLSDIRYLQAAGNYVSFFTEGKEILGSMTMKEALTKLPGGQFIRIHKSYIVNLRHVQVVEGGQVHIAGRKLPIGDLYRVPFMRLLTSSSRPW